MIRCFIVASIVFCMFSCGLSVKEDTLNTDDSEDIKSHMDIITDLVSEDSYVDVISDVCLCDIYDVIADIREDSVDAVVDVIVDVDYDVGVDYDLDVITDLETNEDYLDAGYKDEIVLDVKTLDSEIINPFDFGSPPERPRCDDKTRECENYCKDKRTWMVCLYDEVNKCYYFSPVTCPDYVGDYGCYSAKRGCGCYDYYKTLCKQDDGTYRCEDLINGGAWGFAQPHCGDCNTKCPSDKPICREGKCSASN